MSTWWIDTDAAKRPWLAPGNRTGDTPGNCAVHRRDLVGVQTGDRIIDIAFRRRATSWALRITIALALALAIWCFVLAYADAQPAIPSIKPFAGSTNYVTGTIKQGAKALTVTTLVIVLPPVYWKDSNDCTWAVFKGITNGPSCPEPPITNLTLAWSKATNRNGIPTIIMASSNLITWWQMTNVPASATSWSVRLNPGQPKLFWRLR